MLRFEWNALRPEDQVLVHEAGAGLALTSGVVTMIDTHRGANGVGIRVVAADGDGVVLRPSYMVVHRDPRDPTEPCWRCEALAETS